MKSLDFVRRYLFTAFY